MRPHDQEGRKRVGRSNRRKLLLACRARWVYGRLYSVTKGYRRVTYHKLTTTSLHNATTTTSSASLHHLTYLPLYIYELWPLSLCFAPQIKYYITTQVAFSSYILCIYFYYCTVYVSFDAILHSAFIDDRMYSDYSDFSIACVHISLTYGKLGFVVHWLVLCNPFPTCIIYSSGSILNTFSCSSLLSVI